MYRLSGILLCWALTSVSAQPPHTAPRPNPRILVLHSYHYGFAWTENISKGIRTVIDSLCPEVEIVTEFMDVKRIYGEEYFSSLSRLFLLKYVRQTIDVIITTDDWALGFMLDEGKDILPGVPLVFCGVNDYDPNLRAETDRPVTGVVENIDIQGTVRAALQLHPQTTDIAFISDGTVTGRALTTAARMLSKGYPDSLRFTYIAHRTMDQLRREVNELPRTAIVIAFVFTHDRYGRIWSHEYNLKRLSSKASVPIYSVWEFYLGHGIVGGMLTSGEAQGKVAAQMAHRILRGAAASDIPIQLQSPNRYLFDYEYLRKFQIDMSRLPPGSMVINEPTPIYEEYAALTWSSIAVFVLLLTAIGLLTGYIALRRRSQEQLTASLHEKEILLRELYHRTKNNMQVISAFLELQAAAVPNEDIQRIVDDGVARIRTMSLAHEMLYKTRNLSRINLRDYIAGLVRLVEASFRGPSQRVEIRQSVDDEPALIDVAIPCGLIVNELLSNALKHAFPDNRKGVVEVGLHRVEEHLFQLTIADNGVGLPPDFDITASPTLGVQLVQQIVKRQLGGSIELEADGGVRWTMRFRDDLYGERV